MTLDWSIPSLVLAAALVLIAGYSIVSAARTHLPWSRWRVMALLACRVVLLLAVAAWVLGARLTLRHRSAVVEYVVVADRSASLSSQGRKTVDDWITQATDAARRAGGSITVTDFGADPRDGSALSEALEQARHRFTGRGEKRLLLVSDGRGTTSDPVSIARQLRADNISVLAVPADALAGESLVADLTVPAAAWRSVPTPVEVTLRAAAPTTCRLTMSVDGEQRAQRDVQLPAGLTSIEFKHTFDKDGVHRIDVRADFGRDGLSWNNTASALIDVPLAPRVVILSDPPAASAALQATLVSGGMVVRTLRPQDLPDQVAADCIILDNVRADAVGEPKLKALEVFVHDGGALAFAGGSRAYAAGGYANTPLEPAFPVLLTPNKEHQPYAFCVVLDNSWSMNEGVTSNVGKINLAKEIAIAAIDGLTKGDVLAFVSFDSDYHQIIPATTVETLEPAKYEISRIGAFGMTNILGGLNEAAKTLSKVDAANKYILLISDGKETETGTDYSRLLADLERYHVTLSTVAVGLSVDEKLMNTLAYAGKGRYYHAKSLKEIPSIVLQEAKGMEDQLAVTTPLPPKKLEDDPALTGIDVASLPQLAGYNRSRARPHAWTPLVISRKNDPLLARMRYGRGQSLAFLSSASPQWAKDWITTRPGEYAAFWRQAVVSVLGPPHRPLSPTVDFGAGSPAFAFPSTVGSASADRLLVSRLIGGQLSTNPLDNETPVGTHDADAILVTASGKTNRAFAWSRTFGREFDDPPKGVQTLKDLCAAAGGTFAPDPQTAFAPGHAVIPIHIAPAAWLIIAALLLIVELLLRRGPALAYALRRRPQAVEVGTTP